MRKCFLSTTLENCDFYYGYNFWIIKLCCDIINENCEKDKEKIYQMKEKFIYLLNSKEKKILKEFKAIKAPKVFDLYKKLIKVKKSVSLYSFDYNNKITDEEIKIEKQIEVTTNVTAKKFKEYLLNEINILN